MKHDVFAIEGAANPPFRGGMDPDEVSNSIRGIYNLAAEQGGRIIAAHNLACDLDVTEDQNGRVQSRVEFLFLVLEMPDDYVPE